jgi:hypothetical protein
MSLKNAFPFKGILKIFDKVVKVIGYAKMILEILRAKEKDEDDGK